MCENCVNIACITDTWLKETIPCQHVNIPGYNSHRSNWKDGRRGGGVAVFVRNSLPCVRLSALENANVETVWLLYRRPRMPHTISHVVVGAVYHPPARDGSVMLTHIFDCLDTVTHDHPYARVVLVGDFNKMRDAMLMSYPLKQVVRPSTHGSAILNKIYTNISDWGLIGMSVLSSCRISVSRITMQS